MTATASDASREPISSASCRASSSAPGPSTASGPFRKQSSIRPASAAMRSSRLIRDSASSGSLTSGTTNLETRLPADSPTYPFLTARWLMVGSVPVPSQHVTLLPQQRSTASSGGRDHAGRLHGLRDRPGRVQRRSQPRPPAGELPAESRPVPAGELPQGPLVPAAAAGIPRTAAALLEGGPAVVRVLLRRVRRPHRFGQHGGLPTH